MNGNSNACSDSGSLGARPAALVGRPDRPTSGKLWGMPIRGPVSPAGRRIDCAGRLGAQWGGVLLTPSPPPAGSHPLNSATVYLSQSLLIFLMMSHPLNSATVYLSQNQFFHQQ